jgi:hypothetical protein
LSRRVFLRRGERITCGNGHTIATVTRDILDDPRPPLDMGWFIGWTIPVPRPDKPPDPCPLCGERWLRNVHPVHDLTEQQVETLAKGEKVSIPVNLSSLKPVTQICIEKIWRP